MNFDILKTSDTVLVRYCADFGDYQYNLSRVSHRTPKFIHVQLPWGQVKVFTLEGYEKGNRYGTTTLLESTPENLALMEREKLLSLVMRQKDAISSLRKSEFERLPDEQLKTISAKFSDAIWEVREQNKVTK